MRSERSHRAPSDLNESPSSEEVRLFILGLVGESLASSGVELADVPPTFDLLLEGLIDSFGVVEIIAQLEQHYGVELDLDDIDVDDLTRVGPLSEYVAVKAAR